MTASLFSRRFRLRRRNLPRVRPRDAPYGYVDEIGWLSENTLWIDGWLTLEPVDELEVEIELGSESVALTATCLQGPPFFTANGVSARRWILLLTLGWEHATASRAQRLTLDTDIGHLLWLGGVDRLISPDVVSQFVQGALPPGLVEDLNSLLTRGRKIEDLDLEDPMLHRNLEALRRYLNPPPPGSQGLGRHTGTCAAEVRRIDDLGRVRIKPPVSLIIPLVVPPDLLEHHFPQLERSRGTEHWEVLLVVSAPCDGPELSKRLRGLVELYGVAVKVVRVRGATSWAESVMLGAELASGEHLVFLHGHALSFDADALASLVAPLSDEESAADVTTPVVQTFDGTVRSAGVYVDLQRAPGLPPAIRPVPVNRTPAEVGAGLVDGCGIDSFAIRRSLFLDLHGVAGAFDRPDYEVIDLCLRAAAKGHSVLRVPVTFTRFVEGSSPPSLLVDIPTDEGDAFLLGRRRRLYASPDAGSEPAPTGNPVVTVVVPTLNPGRHLPELLDRLDAQQEAPPFEVFVIDSSSRDRTVSLLREREVRHVVIPRKEFNHGLTRNLGVREARGELVAFLSQDAMPEPGWLAGLAEAFGETGVAGAYSRQLPRPDASPFVRNQLARWPAADEEPRRQEIPRLDLFMELSPEERLNRICFDNVSSAVRRSVALRIPFRDLAFGEDRDWAYRVLTAGYAIEYCPESKVVHSHERSFGYQLRRTFMDHRLIRSLLGMAEPPSWTTFHAGFRNETARLLHQASPESSAWRRLRTRLAAPFRALAGVAGAHLAARSVRGVASGSRTWRWITRHLARGV